MFDNIETGQTVLIRFAGSVDGLAMRAQYHGERDGVHHLTGTGVMSDAVFTASEETGSWLLSSGRALTGVEVI